MLAFDVFEHVVTLRGRNVVGEYLGIVVVEFKDSRKSLMGFFDCVEPLQVFREVIEDEVFFEDRDYMSLFVIHDV